MMVDQHVIAIDGVPYVRTNGYKSDLAEVTVINDYPSAGKSTVMHVPFGRMIYLNDKRHPDMKGK